MYAQSSFQGSFAGAGNASSQYRGNTRQFQPTGPVQSVYRQNQAFANQANAQYGVQSTQQYHAANYRGNQPGHDNYLRSDSQAPSSFAAGYASNAAGANFSNQFATSAPISGSIGAANAAGASFNNQFATSAPVNGSFGASNFNASQFGAAGAQAGSQYQGLQQSYHAANYRGNQPGHDTYLRADSQSPSNIQAGAFARNNFAASAPVNGSFGSQYQAANSFRQF